jgi:peptide/nickel transport system substrate-binding protein
MNLRHSSIKIKLVLKKFYLDVRHSHLKDLRNQILLYFKKMPDVVHLRNIIMASAFLSVIMLVMFAQDFSSLAGYYKSYQPKKGGVYNEGVIGNIEKINPLFVSNEAEASANRLVFSGLTRVMPNNEIKGDLAESWEVKEENQVYIFHLRKNIVWHDDHPFTVEDVLFTYNLIQNPDTRTNYSAVWQGVSFEKLNDSDLKISLPNSFNNFLEVASQPILPEHLLKGVDPQNIKVAEFNTSPIGTGPYKFLRFDQAGNETEVVFEANENFQPHQPYIEQVHLRLYSNFEQLYNGLLRKQIEGITQVPYDKIGDVEKKGSFKLYQYYLPRYKLIVFNLRNEILATKEIRKAISDSVERKELVDKGLSGKALQVFAPILPGKEGYDPKLRVACCNLGAVNEALDKAGWLKKADGYRGKEGKDINLRLVVSDEAENKKVAELIKNQLKVVGIKLEVVISEPTQFQADFLRPRNFDIVLLGQDLGADSDIYSFWHSSQVNDPGLNISGFKDRKVDKLLEQIRKSNDSAYRAERYREIQNTLVAEVPSVYLYNPVYTIGISDSIKGFYTGKTTQPINHLNNIFDWYIKTK